MAINIPITQKGYIYIYVSNETPGAKVWFDDLTVTHIENEVVQADDYYPFGLTMASTSYMGEDRLRNDYLFNAESEFETNANWYNTPFRKFDGALGRFTGIDFFADFLPGINPYQYGYNNPIFFNDPLGLCPECKKLCPTCSALDGVTVTATSLVGTTGATSFFSDGLFGKGLGLGVTIGGVIKPPSVQDHNTGIQQGVLEGLTGENLLTARQVLLFDPESGVGVIAPPDQISVGEDGLINVDLTPNAFENGRSIGNLFGNTIFATSFLARPGSVLPKNTKDAARAAAARTRSLGKAGEDAVGLKGPKTAIRVNGRTRIPDELTPTTLTEVKNVKVLSFARQLRDFNDFSQLSRRTFILYTRPSTTLSGSLQKAISQGQIIHRFIPR